MSISMDEVKKLRDETGQPIMQCKKALQEADGDFEEAKVVLKRKGVEVAEKKSDRELGAGAIQSYIHNSYDVGAIVSLVCETDFVARNEDFIQLAYDIAMQIVATKTMYINREEVSEEDMQKIYDMFKEDEEVKEKPEDIQEKIIKGKTDSYLKERVLLEQEFIKDSETTIDELINSATQKFGERIEVSEFHRLSVR